MNKVRISIESAFRKIARQLDFIDYKKNLKVYFKQIGIYFFVCTILINCIARSKKSQINSFFESKPTTLIKYLIN